MSPDKLVHGNKTIMATCPKLIEKIMFYFLDYTGK